MSAPLGSPAGDVVTDRLGAASLTTPAAALSRETTTSFRGIGNAGELAERLGPLADLPGQWHGGGFNLIARPDFTGHNDIFLELSLTRESLVFNTIGSPIPNRGSAQDDIDLAGAHYLQQISDASTGGALHIEPGIWLSVPATHVPQAPPSVTRLACIPHGDALTANGSAFELAPSLAPKIEPANTVPFAIGSATPAPGTPNPFPEYDLAAPTHFRTDSGLLHGITQAMVTNPNSVLEHRLAGQKVLRTQVLEVNTKAGGGVANIPFVAHNADAVAVSSTFWIEHVQGPRSVFLQLQYTQTVLLDFLGLSWPHVSVATLIKTF
jgi:hypothetical protein